MITRRYAYAAGIAMGLALFAACGDDVTEVTNVNENASLDQVEKFKELPKCKEDVEGTLVFVKDSAKVFGCTSDGWIRLNGIDGVDGKKGKNGKDGKDGADGASCTVKQNKSNGYDVVCDGKAVGALENGSNGDGGVSGTAGASCTVKQNKKRTGFDVTCGDTTVTIMNGADGADGNGCVLEDGENGTVSVTCGDDASSTTLFKATCGKIPYDPETQFCYVDFSGSFAVGYRCKYREKEKGDFSEEPYDPTNQFCDGNDTLRYKCWVKLEQKGDAGEDQYEGREYDYANEYCDGANGMIKPLAYCVKGDKRSPKYQPEYQYCYKTKLAEGIQVAEMPQCGEDRRYFNPRTHYCTLKSSGESDLHDMKVCTKSGKVKDSLDIDVRYTGANDLSGRGSICDTRDYQVYKYTTIKTTTKDYVWMAQNLNYSDSMMIRPTAEGDLHLDSTSFCYDNDPANCVKYGRLYTWSAAIDSVRLNSGKNPVVCGYGASKCEMVDGIRGICPVGWHLPSKEEANVLNGGSGSLQAYKVNDWALWSAGVDRDSLEWEWISNLNLGNNETGFAALPAGYGTFKEDEWIYEGLRSATMYWTSTEYFDSVVDYTGDESHKATFEGMLSSFGPMSSYDDKYNAYSIRCVKDVL
jgi:uncharacterized protein (TIGR02145 family)